MKALLETTLNKYQADIIDDMKMEGDFHSDKVPSTRHDEVFARYNDGDTKAEKIIIPLKNVFSATPNKGILEHLANHGITVHDYTNNVALQRITTNKGTKVRPIKISKALEMTNASEELKKAFINDGARVRDKTLQLVISRNPYDIGAMSTNRGWHSCQEIPENEGERQKLGSDPYYHHIIHEFKHGTLAAYITTKGDDNIDSPMARTLIKRYISGEHDIYRPVGIYKGVGTSAEKTLQDFTQLNYPANSNEKYTMAKGVYPEGAKSFNTLTNNTSNELYDTKMQLAVHSDKFSSFRNHGINDLDIQHNYEDGNLHSTETTPAIVAKSKDGSTYTMHFHHGTLHNENGPAIIEKDSDGNIVASHYYLYGNRHSNIDGTPSSMIKHFDREGKLSQVEMTWHKFGMQHDDPTSNASRVVFQHDSYGDTMTIHHKNYNKTPIEGIATEQYYKHSYGSSHKITGSITSPITGNILNERKNEYRDGELYETNEEIYHPKYGNIVHNYNHKLGVGTLISRPNVIGTHDIQKVYTGSYKDIHNEFKDNEEF